MFERRRSMFMVVCSVLGCGSPRPDTLVVPAEPEQTETEHTAAFEGARAFQADYDRDLREDEGSFLTVVSAHYLAPGDELSLALVDGAWVESEAVGVHLEASAEALAMNRGDDQTRFTERASVPASADGRFNFTVSLQDSSWRVLIHDRDAELRASFPGVTWFPIDESFIVEASFERRAPREASVLQTSRGVTKTLYVAGEAHFELDGRAQTLLVFAYELTPRPDEPLLVPFRDQTTGRESYGGGRYLEPMTPPGERLELDFNRATNPLCAYSEHYNCPRPPSFNSLESAIRAGAMTPH